MPKLKPVYTPCLLSLEELSQYKHLIPRTPTVESWWLGTPGIGNGRVCVVSYCGDADRYGIPPDRTFVGVRPALHISNPDKLHSPGDTIKEGKYEWTVLDANKKHCLALCTKIIAVKPFDKASNNYEESDIKIYLEGLIFEKSKRGKANA